MSNSKQEKNNHNRLIAIALVGVIAAGIVLAAPVYALTDDGSAATNNSTSTTAQSNERPQINGSLKISSILDQIISRSGVTFADASTKAADAANGNTVGGRLGIVQGYLVYDMKVLSDDGMHRVIVDAGNGSVLFVSPAHQIGGHQGFFGSAGESFMKHKQTMRDEQESENQNQTQ